MLPQPTSRMCFVCGRDNPVGLHLHFQDNGVDEVITAFTIAPEFQGYPGVAHGGIVTSILDEVGGRVMLIGQPLRLFVTARIEVRFRRPVPTGVPLRGVGKLVKPAGRLCTAQAQILSPENIVLARAEVALAEVPADIFKAEEADRLGWRVDA